MLSDDGYRTVAAVAEGECRDRGSKFLGFVYPASGETGAQSRLKEVQSRYPDATHHCWAWRVGWPPQERSSDAGEPAGTAGQPMLRVLQGMDLSDCLAVVVRWFGGTKLGKGGLARAYAGAVREALDGVEFEERFATSDWVLDVPYERLGAVKSLVRPPEIQIVDQTFSDTVRLRLRVAVRREAEIRAALADLKVTALAEA